MDNIWNPPEPRKGWLGEWDKFVGPGQTRAELWLIILPSILAGLILPIYAILADLGWSILQLAVAGLLACDLTGGVITNATATAKRWYHRPSQTWQKHLGFISAHALHIALVAWLFRGMDWVYFAVFYTFLLGACLILVKVKLYIQRPVAMLLLVIAMAADFYVFPQITGMEWFIPVLFLKLLVSHLLKEIPFPNTSNE